MSPVRPSLRSCVLPWNRLELIFVAAFISASIHLARHRVEEFIAHNINERMCALMLLLGPLMKCPDKTTLWPFDYHIDLYFPSSPRCIRSYHCVPSVPLRFAHTHISMWAQHVGRCALHRPIGPSPDHSQVGVFKLYFSLSRPLLLLLTVADVT